MGEEAMVDIDPELAHRTLEQLAKRKFSVGAAMLVRDDSGDQFLHVYSGFVDMQGPAESYRALQAALAGVGGLVPLRSIRLLPFRRPEAQALRGAIGVEGRSSVQLQDSLINGYFFDDVTLLKTPQS